MALVFGAVVQMAVFWGLRLAVRLALRVRARLARRAPMRLALLVGVRLALGAPMLERWPWATRLAAAGVARPSWLRPLSASAPGTQ